MFDIRQSVEYAKHLEGMGWIAERVGNVNYFIRKFPLVGSFMKVQRPKDIYPKTIEKLKNNYRVFRTVIEPRINSHAKILQGRGYKLSKSPYLPTKTLEIDLTLSRRILFDNLKKDCKYALRKTEKLPLFTEPELKVFHASYKKSVFPRRYVPSLNNLRSLKANFTNSLFLTSHNGLGDKELYHSGAIFLVSGINAYYWQAFTSKEGRSTLSQYRLVWEGILWAKSLECRVFDFEGIYDSRFPNKSWHGFTHFKKSFGSKEVTYPGAFVRTRLPFIH